ncbi:hypothetical protein A3E42_00430 [Candidatus Gottesmanbacteria bacterium RIFCSPHIGHO2_12_FULL_40_13]|nr:MAG: hypothetical protein A3E42_00430 [Candidatus Gottesmanbacteria bacterium RIFCSPHIGHO2_12_FULL_40_13]
MRKKNRRKKIGKFKPALFIITFLLFLPFIYSYKIYSINPQLKFPRISKVNLSSDPLVLSNIRLNVLGAQAIEPFDIVKYVNTERNKKGSQPLIINEKLVKAARMRAEVILKYQNFSHQDPFENIELITVMPKVGYSYSYATENIGMGGLSAEDFVSGFMNSTSHRLNLLDPQLYHTGTAVVTGPYKQYFVNIAVQLFAVPSSREEYLGYNDIDRKNYGAILTRLDYQLNPLILNLHKFISNKQINDEKIQKIRKQKEILMKLLEIMNEDKPFKEEHIALISEYNGYL